MIWLSTAAMALVAPATSLDSQQKIVLDSWEPGFRWENEWDYVTQTGQQTGNNEVQDYVPSQVQLFDNNSLGLVLERGKERRYLSGKIRSKQSLSQLAPNGGSLEILFELPKNHFRDNNGGEYWNSLAPGLWPAMWIVPKGVAWPTGGEIDLMEMMHRRERADSALTGFSTLHFGPRRGVDAVYDGHWGLPLASFKWGKNGNEQSLYFRWRRVKQKWLMEQWINGVKVWDQATDYTGRFYNFEQGKNFKGAAAWEFSRRGAGDPATIFQRAFDDLPMYLNVNMALGGTPFGYDQQIDRALESSVLRINRFRLWRF